MKILQKSNLTDTRLLIFGLSGLLILAVLMSILAPSPTRSGSVRSSGAGGAKALREWLEESGYEIRELVQEEIDPTDLDVIFILNPAFPYTFQEGQVLRDWVQQGNTLIVAGNRATINSVLFPFDVTTYHLPSDNPPLSLTSPTLINPPFDNLKPGLLCGIESSRSDLAVHLDYQNVPVLASFKEGQGTVWVATMIRPFTNIGLNDPASASLMLNLLAGVPAGAKIGFDESENSETPSSFGNWLFSSPAGWSILSGLTLTMTFLMLRGRRFGQAVPIREERLLREPVEYIQAMANLLRRSGQRVETLRHYRNQLRRAIAKRYALDPSMKDEEMLRSLSLRGAALDLMDLKILLGQLSKKQVSESELVMIGSLVDEWLKKL